MSKLSPVKRRAVLALVEHGAVSKAADACNVSRMSIYRWMREPLFTQALREASESQVEQASRRLTALMSRAIDELERLLSDESTQQRRLAVDSILSHGIRLRELTELEQRVANLERRMEHKR